ncbi:hypothetical protein PCANC_05907 [Puccinia coronata f. sp. avenae]|uniref:Uncharacterized protein n=1 Tax=Puccinia coronata f. sp. avenae TaxID=200324 RepID=A0A2N5VY36_9BASI|nr:hypothetical protein PCANC_05907 [Puccinia coronata f. sp. avenae]
MDLRAQFRAVFVPSHQISQPQCLVEWYSVGRDPSLLFRSACPHHSYSFDFGFSNKKSRSFRCDWLHAVIAYIDSAIQSKLPPLSSRPL